MAKDRSALDAYLKELGFARLGSPSGELVLMEPEASETREVRDSERAVVVTISTRARDRHGDVIDPEGVRLDRFRKNPVVLYSHAYSGLPVAKSLWERVLREGEEVELVAKPQFHLQTELSREVWALVRKGVLSAWSVGFVPEIWEPVMANGRRAAGGHITGFRVTKWDLLEYSCVPVPANFEALTHELKEKRITAPALVKSLAPLGLEKPDLVPHDVRNNNDGNTDVQDTQDAERTSANSLEPLQQGRVRGNPAHPVHSCKAPYSNKDAQDTHDGRRPEPRRGRDHPAHPVHPCKASFGFDVREIVRRAFEKVIARARGEGFL